MEIQDDATIQAGKQAAREIASAQEDVLNRASLALSRMDEALAALRNRSVQPQPVPIRAASHAGVPHEYR